MENCEWCGKFIPEDMWELATNFLCRKCDAKLLGEHAEVETGIGTGQFIDYADENLCRHNIKK